MAQGFPILLSFPGTVDGTHCCVNLNEVSGVMFYGNNTHIGTHAKFMMRCGKEIIAGISYQDWLNSLDFIANKIGGTSEFANLDQEVKNDPTEN